MRICPIKIPNRGNVTLDTGSKIPYTYGVLNTGTMYAQDHDEFVVGCSVNIAARRFAILSDQGEQKVLECEDVDSFMRVLEVVRAFMPEDQVTYV